MKETTKYVCEICGTEYNEKSDAAVCERNHKTIKEIIPRYVSKLDQHRGYPVKLTVVLDCGKELVFEPIKGWYECQNGGGK